MRRFTFLGALAVSVAIFSVVTLRAQNAADTSRTVEVDFSKLSNDRFIARVQTLMHEARNFEAQGDLQSAFELASRAHSILITVQRTTDATWPTGEQIPAELIARLRETARRVPSQAVVNPTQPSSTHPERLELLTPARRTAPIQETANQISRDSLPAPIHSVAKLGGTATNSVRPTQNADAEALRVEQLDRSAVDRGAFEDLARAKSNTRNKTSKSVVNANVDPQGEVPRQPLDLPMNGVESLFAPINQDADPHRQVLQLPMNGVEPLFAPANKIADLADVELELPLLPIQGGQSVARIQAQPIQILPEPQSSPIQPVAEIQIVSQKYDARRMNIDEPRLLLEQLDRSFGDWEPIDDRANSAPKNSNGLSNAVINANVDPFSNAARQPANDIESPFAPSQRASGEPDLFSPTNTGRHVAAPIPTWIGHDTSPSANSESNGHRSMGPELPKSTINAGPSSGSVERSPFDFESVATDSSIKAQDTTSSSDTHQGSPWLLRIPSGDPPANSQSEHSHADQVLLWVLAGIGLTLATIWLLRALMKSLFGVQMSIAVRGKTVGHATTAPAAAKFAGESNSAASNSMGRESNLKSVAFTSDALPAFPFRLVGGSDDDDATDNGGIVENSKSQQGMLRTAYEGNLALQANDRRDAA